MSVNIEQTRVVRVPINPSGLIKMQDLRDFVEATEDAPEQSYAVVSSDELFYEVGL